jgi:hypothetical protein
LVTREDDVNICKCKVGCKVTYGFAIYKVKINNIENYQFCNMILELVVLIVRALLGSWQSHDMRAKPASSGFCSDHGFAMTYGLCPHYPGKARIIRASILGNRVLPNK